MLPLTRKQSSARPIKVMQFGEGNFLRGFIDWMIQRMDDSCALNAQVQIIQPRRPNGNADHINAQNGLYTLIQRGISNGTLVENSSLIDVVESCINPYSDWDKVVATACLPTLRFVFSNTTEAGIEYRHENYAPGATQESFPAKLASLLYERFKAFNGAPDKGLLIFPCELIENNGTQLNEIIHKHAADWKLPPEFAQWLNSSCAFFNTLVDRIVAGYPSNEAYSYEQKFGYEDKLMVCCEPFHFLAIEGNRRLVAELPFEKAGLNVVVTDNLEPYRTRKVRFLNGVHTCVAPAAILAGHTLVDEMMADELLNDFIQQAVFQEIFPTVNLPDAEKRSYAASVLERFRNPYARHRLLSIALNSISKWKVRVLPSLKDHLATTGRLPRCLAFSLAVLLRFYMIENGKGFASTVEYSLNDTPDVLEFFSMQTALFKQYCNLNSYIINVLGNQTLWGEDLSTIPSLSAVIAQCLGDILQNGIRTAMQRLLF